MKEKEKYLMVLLLLTGLLETSKSFRCPRYCSCFFSYNKNLKTVECVAKQLINIDLGVPFDVQILDLSNNSISILEDRGFKKLGLLDITELYLRFNSIRSIGLQAFSGLSNLQHLDLTQNHLYYLMPWTFHENLIIQQLILANNPIGHGITNDDSGIFLDIPSLQVLDISNCHFGHLHQNIFTKMQLLQVVNVSGNDLNGLDIVALEPLKMLRVLDISRNHQWSCDTNMKQIESWLTSQSIQLIGSSCDIDKVVEKPKLEKMISVVETDNSLSEEEEEVDRYWTENEKDINKSCLCEIYNTTFSNDFSDKVKINIPSSWLFVIGFQFGILFSLFAAFIWVSWKHPKQNLDSPHPPAEAQPIMVCPETPPPTYRELFYV